MKMIRSSAIVTILFLAAAPLLAQAPPSSLPGPENASGALKNLVAVVPAGAHFRAALKNGVDSGLNQPGDEVQATVIAPITAGGVELVPAGSRLLGQITNVVSARHFQFGANGRIDIRFTAVETPDGRRYPLSASIDTDQIRLSGAMTTAGRARAGAAAGAAQRKGSEIKIPAGAALPVQLDESLRLTPSSPGRP